MSPILPIFSTPCSASFSLQVPHLHCVIFCSSQSHHNLLPGKNLRAMTMIVKPKRCLSWGHFQCNRRQRNEEIRHKSRHWPVRCSLIPSSLCSVMLWARHCFRPGETAVNTTHPVPALEEHSLYLGGERKDKEGMSPSQCA